MIDALVSGRMRGTVNLRTTNTGKPFAVWRMATTDKNGDGVLCSCIAFSQTAIDGAQRLSDGDSIAVSGEAAISTWQASDGTARHGLDVLVHVVMTAYHLGRKRKASEPPEGDDQRGPL
jgi:single-stranded DNA-binding protein